MLKRILSVILMGSMIFSLCSCEYTKIGKYDKPKESQEPNPSGPIDISNVNIFDKSAIMTDQLYDKGENIMISPLSLYTTLGMVMNGAEGETKKELENFIGLDTTTLNKITEKLMSTDIPEWAEDTWPTIKMANGIWIKDDNGKYTLSPEFEKVIDNTYHGQVKLTNMSKETVNEINDFTKKNTNNMIPQIIDDISPETIAILVNALYFEAVWSEQYEDFQVENDKFHGLDGDTDIKIMNSMEEMYYENDKATGFAKWYMGPYKFIAILPKIEGDFDISDLDISSFLESETTEYDVNTYLPKFEFDWGKSLVDMMKKMGVVDSFNGTNANFRKMFEKLPDNENVFISDILQKTRIELSETGTKAAAVTAIMMETCGIEIPEEKETKEVRLDRPFAFIIMDTENNLPLFMGKVVNL